MLLSALLLLSSSKMLQPFSGTSVQQLRMSLRVQLQEHRPQGLDKREWLQTERE